MIGLAVMDPDGVRDVAVDYVPVVLQPRGLAMPSDGAWITGEVRWPEAPRAPRDRQGLSGVSRLELRLLILAAFFVGAATISTLVIVLAALVR